jgi:hypothetical protein
MKPKLFALTLVTAAAASPMAVTFNPVTFNKDVLPVLQHHCQSCHRPGQIAPMSFLSYESTRPWAKAIRAAVATRKMPPWYADPRSGHFTNDRSLRQADIDTIVKWADSGATRGDPRDAPAPVEWPPDGWQIKPDVIVTGPAYEVPARGIVEWTWVVIPSPFKEDTWVTSVEVRPSAPAVTHHICLAYKTHTPEVVYNKPVWQDRPRNEHGDEINDRRPDGRPRDLAVAFMLAYTNGLEECYEPGRAPADFRPYHAAKLLPAGTDIAIQMHFSPNGTAVTNRVEIGFTVAKEPPQRRYLALSASAPQDHETFAIPPNDPDWQSPSVDLEFQRDVELVGLMPHMHLRGKDMSFELQYPDGRKQMILHVPNYDFNWQLWYETSIQAPKGTRMHIAAHYDNSANNKNNPDPNKSVYYGDMTWDEMMFPSYGVVVDDKSLDQRKVVKRI